MMFLPSATNGSPNYKSLCAAQQVTKANLLILTPRRQAERNGKSAQHSSEDSTGQLSTQKINIFKGLKKDSKIPRIAIIKSEIANIDLFLVYYYMSLLW
jgi:hypothetical protein